MRIPLLNRLITAVAKVMAERRVEVDICPERKHDLLPRSWVRGSITVRWRGGYSDESRDGKRDQSLRLRWNLWTLGLYWGIHRYGALDECPLSVEFGLPPVSFVASYEGTMPMWWPTKYGDSRSLSFRISEWGTVAWNLWTHDDRSNDAPRWRKRTFFLDTLLLGHQKIETLREETKDFGVPLPHGRVAPVRMTLIHEAISRPRWPGKKVRQRVEIHCSEAGYALGVRDSSVWTVGGFEEGIGKLIEMTTRAKLGLGAFAWQTTIKHCPTCGGMGLAPRCCASCNGQGLRPLVDVSRDVLAKVGHFQAMLAKGLTPIVGPAAQQFSTAVWQLIERAASEPITAERAQAHTDALLIAARAYLCLGRIGPAAEAAALAMRRSEDMEQAEQAQCILSWVSRIAFKAPPSKMLAGELAQPFTLLAQPRPNGGLTAVACWSPEGFARLMTLDEEKFKWSLNSLAELRQFVEKLEVEAESAGWHRGEPLSHFVARLRGERNQATDTLDQSLAMLRDALLFSIPEGPLGDPVRDFYKRAGAFLEQRRAGATPQSPAI